MSPLLNKMHLVYKEENNTIEIKKDNFDLPMNTPFLRPTVRG